MSNRILPIIRHKPAYVVYRGASALNGAPIVAILTGIGGTSTNAKTGPMAQLAIYVNGMRPTDATHTGQDAAVCGDCPMRPSVYRETGAPRCYVALGRSYDQSHRARSGDAVDLAGACLALQGEALRLGAYGDPAAIPAGSGVVQALTSAAVGWTGYTHQWRKRHAQWLRAYCMASVDHDRQLPLAWGMGWRTFRVSDSTDGTEQPQQGEPLGGVEIACPYNAHNVQCIQCGLCMGNSRPARHIVIAAH